MTGLGIKPITEKITITGQTVAGSIIIPANCMVRDILVTNTTANAVTGGLKFGTTAGGVDIVAALAVGASVSAFVTDALLLKRFFSSTTKQQIFFDAVTLWNSANVNITIIYHNLNNG